MGNNLITNLGVCMPLTLDTFGGNLNLLYYSHIPTAIVSILIGLYVLIKGGGNMLSKIFFFLTSSFVIWSALDLFTWLSPDTRVIMFTWSLTGVVESLFFILSLYFFYVFAKKEDISLKYKFLTMVILLPLIIMMPTKFNLSGFDSTQCYSLENNYSLYYKYFIEILSSIVLLVFSMITIKRADKKFRKQLVILFIGISLFLFSFFSAIFLSSYLVDNGWNMFGYKFEMYGLFGTTIFIGFLAYLIVQYKAFEIKLIGAQALVVSLIILVGEQFFYATELTSQILTGITLTLTLIFGYILVKSVQQEVKRKEELEIANAEINERKEQLQQMADKLANANDNLRKLDNAKTEFISIASHQLRTPVTAIKGFASLLLEGSYGELSDGVHGALEKVYASSERLVNLIEDLLNVSRIESGRMQFAFEKASVEKLIKELYDNFILIAKTKKFYLDMKLPEVSLPEIVMDYVKIRELVSNFIDNALKYTEKGGATVKAELRDSGVVIDESGFVIEGKKSEFGKMIRITVSDTGIGIPREEIPYLFKKFSRGKDVSRLHVGGTGLGLYVGKAIAEAHHGQVWVESDGAGLGSRFIIEIPIEHVG